MDQINTWKEKEGRRQMNLAFDIFMNELIDWWIQVIRRRKIKAKQSKAKIILSFMSYRYIA